MSISSGVPTASIGDLAVNTNFRVTSYTDDSANAGNRTVNTLRGKSAIAAAAAAVTITNNKVTANSQIVVTVEDDDATLTHIISAIPGPGSFVITGNAAATGNTKISWTVINL